MSTSNLHNKLSLAFWNIDGLYSRKFDGTRQCKLDFEELSSDLIKHDIIFLAETHCSYKDTPSLANFKITHNIRPKHPRAGKHSGGLAVCIKQNISKGVSFLPTTNSEYMWIKLSKKFFRMDKDLFVAVVYICPSSSTFGKRNDNLFDLLESDILSFKQHGNVILCGDFNASTNTEADFCSDDSINDILNLQLNYVQDQHLPRRSLDSSPIDTNGKQLLGMCRASGLRILNGRFIGDTLGYNTCYSDKGSPSVIDYMLCDLSLFYKNVNTFSIMEPSNYSIHCLLSVSLKTHPHERVLIMDTEILDPLPPCVKWADGHSIKFEHAFQNESIKTDLNTLSQDISNRQEHPPLSLNLCIRKFDSILMKATTVAGLHKCPNYKLKSKKDGQKMSQSTHKNKIWYDKDCRVIKQQLTHLGKLIKNNPFDNSILFSFRHARKLYKATTRKKRRVFVNKTLDSLEGLQSTNPKKFWSIFKKLKGYDKTNQNDPIAPGQWIDHFANLMNKPLNIDESHEAELKDYIKCNKDSIFSQINFTIKESEINQVICKLKNNKASGLDGILNEMLKSSRIYIVPILVKLFNLILLKGSFPDDWRVNTLTPIHKKGDRFVPSNYRGISVCSNLCKLFCTVLHDRIIKFAEEKKLIPVHQIGYRAKSRTSDHLLTLKNLIDKYIRKQKSSYLYTCFVDFKAAFDSVWRTALIYKLVKCEIGGNVLNVIKSMYREVSYCLKLQTGLTKEMKTNVGVKQGCVLSPTLFNLYLADLPNIFDASCDPVEIFDSKFNCLMFADDIVLFSDSSIGLQNSLDKLKSYCEKWHLTVNTEKTKVLIFNKNGKLLKNHSFNFGADRIELVKDYCYLGIIFCASGSFKQAINSLLDKAMKAFFALKQYDIRNNVKVALKLFQTLVLPIARYGCEVWCPFYLHQIKESNFNDLCEKFPIEKLNIKFCKYLLGVHWKASNLAVRGELGKFPLIIDCFFHSLRFWSRNCNLSTDSIVKKSYLDAIMSKSPHKHWLGSIHRVLCHFGFSSLWENQYFMSGDNYCTPVKQIMENAYIKNWRDRLTKLPTNNGANNKLRTYCQFKDTFEIENYILSQKFLHRRSFSKLRISSHSLHIETGRYNSPKTPVDQRLCTICNSGEIEDEQHFMLSCKFYDNERKLLLKKLGEFSDLNFNQADSFLLLMHCNNGDTEFIAPICNFVETCFTKRYHFLNNLGLVGELPLS